MYQNYTEDDDALLCAVYLAKIDNQYNIQVSMQDIVNRWFDSSSLRRDAVSIVNYEEARLCELMPVRCQTGEIYFVEQDLKT